MCSSLSLGSKQIYKDLWHLGEERERKEKGEVIMKKVKWEIKKEGEIKI